MPRFYRDIYNEDGTLKELAPLRKDVPSRIKKRLITDIDGSPYPTAMVVPFIEAVHDRYPLEIMRGCGRGCRFCQAGFLYRPLRERKLERLVELAEEGIKKTGYEELSLVSLSTGDYKRLPELLRALNLDMTSISLPSLHVDNITPEVISFKGFTFAPETADMRLSASINKKFDLTKLLEVAENLFKAGHRKIKLYFMLGLPGEEWSSLEGLYNLVSEIIGLRNGAAPSINISVSSFIPKPHTPFQWERMETLDSLKNKQIYLKKIFRKLNNVKLNYHGLEPSFLEAVFTRGDRRLSSVIYEAWKGGAKFDSWRECFKYSVWMDAFQKTGLDPYFYSHRERDESEVFPWEHIDIGIPRDFFMKERERAREGAESPGCRRLCSECGLCV